MKEMMSGVPGEAWNTQTQFPCYVGEESKEGKLSNGLGANLVGKVSRRRNPRKGLGASYVIKRLGCLEVYLMR